MLLLAVNSSSEAWTTPGKMKMKYPSIHGQSSSSSSSRGRSITQRAPLQAKADNSMDTPGSGGTFYNDDDCMDLCEFDPDVEMYQVTEDNNVPLELDPDTARIRLQMQWELWENQEDCDLEDVRTCGSPCTTCRGGGHTVCRFCMGTKVVSLLQSHSKCPVCNVRGEEVCKSCRGSGWVAPWVSLANFPKK